VSRNCWFRTGHCGRPQGLPSACSGTGEPLHHGFRFDEAPDPAMRALLYVILMVLNLYIWLLIAAAVLSWLVAFNVVNVRNQFVAMIGDFLYRITEPVLRPIRNMMPNLGGLDISPVILILLIIFIQKVIEEYIYPNVF
jgi:YggT family protein